VPLKKFNFLAAAQTVQITVYQILLFTGMTITLADDRSDEDGDDNAWA